MQALPTTKPTTGEARSLSRIIKIAIDGTGGEPIFVEPCWIGHVKTSSTRSDLLTFCHEGPWNEVDNRIWGMNTDSGEVWKIRAREADESISHEYWHADGEGIGYHGRNRDGTQFLGHAHYDDSDRVVRLWRSSEDGYDGPRALCCHDSSMKIQQLHVHPRFDVTGRYVIFTSDISGYGDVYQVEVPSFESLPTVEDWCGLSTVDHCRALHLTRRRPLGPQLPRQA